MGVDQRQAGVFLRQVLQCGDQRGVLEYVGVVAGMEGVAVTEHGGMVTRWPVARKSICAKCLILRIISGFAAILWLRGEDLSIVLILAIGPCAE